MRTPFYFELLARHGARRRLFLPTPRVTDPAFNAEGTLALTREAAAVALFPEMGLSAYSNEDLFHQNALLAEAVDLRIWAGRSPWTFFDENHLASSNVHVLAERFHFL